MSGHGYMIELKSSSEGEFAHEYKRYADKYRLRESFPTPPQISGEDAELIRNNM